MASTIFYFFLWSFLNVMFADSSYMAGILAIIEHIIVLYFLFKGDLYKAFKYYILFTTVSLEISTFVIGGSKSSYYSFFSVPVFASIFFLLEVLIMYCRLRSSLAYHNLEHKSTILSSFSKKLNFLIITGIFAGCFSFIINDNNTLSSGYYPSVFILEAIGFFPKFAIIQLSIYFVVAQDKLQDLKSYCHLLLIGLSFACVLGGILGKKGYYGEDITMLSPLAMSLTPCLLFLCDFDKKDPLKGWTIAAFLVSVVSSFFYPSVVGSKWYLFILFTLLSVVCKRFNIRMGVGLIISLAIIPYIAEFALDYWGRETYIGYKMNQAFGMLNVLGVDSVDDWYYGMGNSALFRFDEIHNVVIEYLNKPLFFLFGKGFGGTTLHYTDILSWETAQGAFSVDQIKMHSYYAMHGPIPQIMLRHGLIGLSFLFYYSYILLKNTLVSGWSFCGFLFLFFFFYWGNSLMVGCLAMIIALHEIETFKSVKA